MPYYTYQCHECGFQFEKRVKIKQRNDVKCEMCESGVELLVPEEVSFGFHNELTHDAPVPQNTGVSSLDFDYDKIIKEDADKKWATIQRRDAHKRAVLRQHPGAKKHQLALTPDGQDYRVLSKDEEQAVLKGRIVQWGRIQKIRESKK